MYNRWNTWILFFVAHLRTSSSSMSQSVPVNFCDGSRIQSLHFADIYNLAPSVYALTQWREQRSTHSHSHRIAFQKFQISLVQIDYKATIPLTDTVHNQLYIRLWPWQSDRFSPKYTSLILSNKPPLLRCITLLPTTWQHTRTQYTRSNLRSYDKDNERPLHVSDTHPWGVIPHIVGKDPIHVDWLR